MICRIVPIKNTITGLLYQTQNNAYKRKLELTDSGRASLKNCSKSPAGINSMMMNTGSLSMHTPRIFTMFA